MLCLPYKATIGDDDSKRPSLLSTVAQAKYDSWNEFKGKSKVISLSVIKHL